MGTEERISRTTPVVLSRPEPFRDAPGEAMILCERTCGARAFTSSGVQYERPRVAAWTFDAPRSIRLARGEATHPYELGETDHRSNLRDRVRREPQEIDLGLLVRVA